MDIINIFFKEWIREGGIRRIIQILLLLLFPIFIFLFYIFSKALIVNSALITVSSIGYVIFIFSSIYAMFYRLESEKRIMEGFPVESLPIKPIKISLIEMIFMFFANLIIIIIIALISVFLLTKVNLNNTYIFSISNIKNYIIPVIFALPYTLISGIILGTFLGSFINKILNMFPESSKRFIYILLFIIIYSTLRPYFVNIWNIINAGDFNNHIYIYSPVNFSLIIGNIFIKGFSIIDLLYSLGFNVILLFLILIVNNKFNVKFNTFDIEFASIKKNIYFLSPVWNIVIKRWFSLPIIIFMFAWLIIVLLQIYYRLFAVFNILCIYIYTFISLDRMFGEKKDYRDIWKMLPIDKKHIEGVFLGSYFLLYMLPVILSMINIFIQQGLNVKINNIGTIETIIAFVFIVSGIVSIIPTIIYFYPYMWGSNEKGKQLKRREVLLLFIIAYIFFTTVGGILATILFNPQLYNIVKNAISNMGVFALSVLFYSILFFTLFINIRSIVIFVLSIGNRGRVV